LILRLFLLLSFTSSLFAAPRELEVWFLSANKKAELEQLIRHRPFVMLARTAELQCQEMGDFCFDPQYGLYKKDDAGAEVDVSRVDTAKTPEIPVAKSVERDLIDCDPKNYFDVFCGKAKKAMQANYKLDIWIDTSSSMREMDFSDKEGGCFRKSMMKRLDESCGFNEKVNVMMFDTGLKQAGSMDALCNNQGLNDMKRLMDWIEHSDAKKLVVITDIYEFHKDFSDFVEKKNGKFRGDKDVMVASQLLDMVDGLARSCR
jgi:hypothetical protein